MEYTLLDNNINKQTELNHSRKVAWLRSDRQFVLSEGVSASLPYYFIEGEVQSNIQKVALRARELGYDALLFGERDEVQVKSANRSQLICDAFAKEPMDVILKLRFDGPVLEMLKNRKYLIETDVKEELVKCLREVQLPKLMGIQWQLTTIPPALLQNPHYRPWTIEEMIMQEVALMEEAFDEMPLLIAEASDGLLPDLLSPCRTVFCASPFKGKPWEEYREENPVFNRSEEGYRHVLKMHNRGMLMMGEGLWPMQKGSGNRVNHPNSHWGDCDLFNQFPSDNRLTIDWGILGLEARLLWLKMLRAKEKTPQRVQLDAWGYQLKEMELRAEENPLMRHFIADAWYFLSTLQSQPVHQGISPGGFWKGRPLNQDPQSDGSPWYMASRLFFSL